MATISCTVQRSSWYEVYLEYTYTQDKITAKTTVSHALKLKQLTSGYDFDTVASVTVGYTLAGIYFSKSGRINIDDKGDAGYTITLASGSTTITHDSAGKGSFTVSVNTSIDSGGWGPGTITLSSQTVDLPDIPRATTIDSLACSTSYLTGTLTYKYTPQNANFYNRCNISLNLDGNYIAIRSISLGKKTSSQQTETVTFSDTELATIYNRLPSTTKCVIRFTFRTYSNSNYSTQVGDASYKEVSLSIPTSIVPSGTVTATPVYTNDWVKSKGIYVEGYSSVKLTWTAEAGLGANISVAQLRCTTTSSDGSQVYQPPITDKTSLTLAAQADSMQFQLRMWDSRSRYSTSEQQKITVHSYSEPIINSLQIERGTYDAGWTADDDGPDVRVVFKTTISLASQGNVYKAAFKFNNSTKVPDYGTVTNLASGTTYSAYFFDIDGESSYTLKITTTDELGNSVSSSIILPTIGVTIEFNDSGKGIAFGKTSEKDAFECAWDAEFSGNLSVKRKDGSLYNVSDTGWIDIGTSEDVSAEDASNTGRNGQGCYYRVINGNHVYVAFNVAFTYSGDAVTINANAIPSGLRPARHAYVLCPTGGRAIARCIVTNAGNVTVDWIQVITTTESTTSSTVSWVDGYVDYWI